MNDSKGFTLIELLVVISVIALLSSVVLSSLNSARNRGKEAAIRQAMIQYRTLLALELSDTGSYANLNATAWYGNSNTCAGINGTSGAVGADFYATSASSRAAQARQICANIVSNNAATAPVSSSNTLAFFIHRPNGSTDPATFSIMAWLPAKARYLCMSHTGASSDIDSNFSWASPGCWNNP